MTEEPAEFQDNSETGQHIRWVELLCTPPGIGRHSDHLLQGTSVPRNSDGSQRKNSAPVSCTTGMSVNLRLRCSVLCLVAGRLNQNGNKHGLTVNIEKAALYL